MFSKWFVSFVVLACSLVTFTIVGDSEAYGAVGRRPSMSGGMSGMSGGMGGMNGMSRPPARRSLKGATKGLPKGASKTKNAGGSRKGR